MKLIIKIQFIFFCFSFYTLSSCIDAQPNRKLLNSKPFLIVVDENGDTLEINDEQVSQKYLQRTLFEVSESDINDFLYFPGDDSPKTVSLFKNDSVAQNTLSKICKKIQVKYPNLKIQALGLSPENATISCFFDSKNRSLLNFVDSATAPIGSLVFPFYFLCAMDYFGYSPCFSLKDKKTTLLKEEANFQLKEDYLIENYDTIFSNENYNLAEALWLEKRSLFGQLAIQFSSKPKFRAYLNDIFLDTLTNFEDYLGKIKLPIADIIRRYSIFSNYGYCLKKIDLIKDITVMDMVYPVYSLEGGKHEFSGEITKIMIQLLELKANYHSKTISTISNNIFGMRGLTKEETFGSFLLGSSDMILGVFIEIENQDSEWNSKRLSEVALEINTEYFQELQAKKHLECKTLYGKLPEIHETTQDCILKGWKRISF